VSELDWASKSYQEQIDSGFDWADKNSAADLLEKTEKTLLSELSSKYEGSEAAKERMARQDPAFKEHLEAQAEARRLANRAKVKWEAIKSLSSMRQTQESLKKAEMNLR
jgi:aconitase A